MIITKLSGGLGNQMFQYAAGKALAAIHSSELFLDLTEFQRFKLRKRPRPYELHIFGMKNSLTPKFFFFKQFTDNYSYLDVTKYEEKYFHYDSAFSSLPNHTHLIGFWQSANYFDSIRSEILNAFDFSKYNQLSDQNSLILRDIQKTDSISIHVRRGDYVTNPTYNATHGLTTLEYYQQSIDLMCTKVSNPNFYVFSDDIAWVKANLFIPTRHLFVEANTAEKSYCDMWLMSQCKHNIIANSSFSWWGAYLNQYEDKVVIAPQKWFNDKTHQTTDVTPDDWMRL